MSDNNEKSQEQQESQNNEAVSPRPAVGTYNSFENELLTVLHLLKYNFHLNAKATIFASLIQSETVRSTDDAAKLTQKVVDQLKKLDGLK